MLQVGGVLFIILGVIGKIGSIFVTIPDPVIGGILLVMFGMVTSVGLTTLQYVDLNSRRYLCNISPTKNLLWSVVEKALNHSLYFTEFHEFSYQQYR